MLIGIKKKDDLELKMLSHQNALELHGLFSSFPSEMRRFNREEGQESRPIG